MPTPTETKRHLAACERSYRKLAGQLADIGFIAAGSVTRRGTRCGKPGCRCQADPPQLHGPYYQWTGKTAGKTVTRRLSEREAALYRDWIANDRHLRHLIAQMRQIADEAAALALQLQTPDRAQRKR